MTVGLVAGLLVMSAPGGARFGQTAIDAPATPVLDWSDQARRAIVPPGPGDAFGSENYGNKFPGEGAVYLAIVHAAMYDAAVAMVGGYRPYASSITAPAEASAAAAIATAAHHTLVGLQPALGLTRAQQALLDGRYANYLARIPPGAAKSNGIDVGTHAASAVLALRMHDGRDANPQMRDLDPPTPGPGVWEAGATSALGLRLSAIKPLVLESGAQFRPAGPNPLTSAEYRDDYREVAELGGHDSLRRTREQTTSALFWTDHDLRQWNDALLRLARDRRLDLLDAARMLAMAHVAGADAMIACFDAKYTYWFWRPYQAIPRADQDGNPETDPRPSWRPLSATPNFPEYPSAHACHTTALSEALSAFFGTDRVRLVLDSRVTGTSREYARLHDVVTDVDWARVLVGFHFRQSDREGANLGRAIARYVVAHRFQPVRPKTQRPTVR